MSHSRPIVRRRPNYVGLALHAGSLDVDSKSRPFFHEAVPQFIGLLSETYQTAKVVM